MIFCLYQNSSKSRLRNLESLNGFVSAATKELMWLNDKEEEEVNFDWSDRNSNMTAKKDNYSVGGPDAVPFRQFASQSSKRIWYFMAVVPNHFYLWNCLINVKSNILFATSNSFLVTSRVILKAEKHCIRRNLKLLTELPHGPVNRENWSGGCSESECNALSSVVFRVWCGSWSWGRRRSTTSRPPGTNWSGRATRARRRWR